MTAEKAAQRDLRTDGKAVRGADVRQPGSEGGVRKSESSASQPRHAVFREPSGLGRLATLGARLGKLKQPIKQEPRAGRRRGVAMRSTSATAAGSRRRADDRDSSPWGRVDAVPMLVGATTCSTQRGARHQRRPRPRRPLPMRLRRPRYGEPHEELPRLQLDALPSSGVWDGASCGSRRFRVGCPKGLRWSPPSIEVHPRRACRGGRFWAKGRGEDGTDRPTQVRR